MLCHTIIKIFKEKVLCILFVQCRQLVIDNARCELYKFDTRTSTFLRRGPWAVCYIGNCPSQLLQNKTPQREMLTRLCFDG